MSERLTPAECETLVAYARLGSARAVAEHRRIRPESVRKCLIDAYAKLGVHGAIQAFRALGWLRPPEMEPSSGIGNGVARGQCERAAAP